MQALGFQVLRWLGRAEALRRQLAKRTPPPAADALLCTALALAWDAERSPYEPFTLVDQAVEAAKRDPATRAQASFINACLRRFLRERDDAGGGHRPRAGGAMEPSALVDRAAASATIRATGSACWRPTTSRRR